MGRSGHSTKELAYAGPKRRLSPKERRQRRAAAVSDREAERRSLSHLYSVPLEPRIDPKTIAARRAEMPDRDGRDLTGLILGDPNPADLRRRARKPEPSPVTLAGGGQ